MKADWFIVGKLQVDVPDRFQCIVLQNIAGHSTIVLFHL